MVQWIKGKLHAKNQGPDSRAEEVMCILRNFRDRQTDIVAVCNQSEEDCMPKIKR